MSAFGSRPFQAQERDELGRLLDVHLGAEHLAQRQGAGQTKVAYLESWKAIEIANAVFGFDGWCGKNSQQPISKNFPPILCPFSRNSEPPRHLLALLLTPFDLFSPFFDPSFPLHFTVIHSDSLGAPKSSKSQRTFYWNAKTAFTKSA